MIAWILLTAVLFSVIGWCIGVKAGANYEHDRLTEFYTKQAKDNGLEIKKYKSFEERLAAKMAEKEIKN